MKPLSVGQLNLYVSRILREDALLSDVCVTGELSNVKYYPSGHVYFSMKDGDGCVRCVMFRGQAQRLNFQLKDGKKVIAWGHCDLYGKSGDFQLYCEDMQEDGTGRLYEEFERLKKKLEAGGYFREDHKKKLPFLPKIVGAVTSPGGAVIQDIRNVVGRRFPGMPIRLYSCPVQGTDAAPKIIDAIRRAVAENVCDVLIVGRGGGSIEDLWPFNDEALAMEIYNCPIPVISAVGHETDFTIADFVSDRRAPTPSAAAELAVPERAKLEDNLREAKTRMETAAARRLTVWKTGLSVMKEKSFFKNPSSLTEKKYLDLDRMLASMKNAVLTEEKIRRSAAAKLGDRLKAENPESRLWKETVKFRELENRFRRSVEEKSGILSGETEMLAEKLALLNPGKVLERGYSILEREDGSALTSERDVLPGASFRVVMKDGRFAAERKK